jgi:hypothetical protein
VVRRRQLVPPPWPARDGEFAAPEASGQRVSSVCIAPLDTAARRRSR